MFRLSTFTNYGKTQTLGSTVQFLPPANQVCEGNVFIPVCLGGGLASQHALGRGVGFPACTGKGSWLPSMHWEEGVGFPACIGKGGLYPGGGGLHLDGSASREGSASGGGICIRGGLDRPPLPRYTGYYGIWSMSGRHASYWNAFL